MDIENHSAPECLCCEIIAARNSLGVPFVVVRPLRFLLLFASGGQSYTLSGLACRNSSTRISYSSRPVGFYPYLTATRVETAILWSTSSPVIRKTVPKTNLSFDADRTFRLRLAYEQLTPLSNRQRLSVLQSSINSE